jgi:glycerol-3-phosphate dehydrogenase (NAD(P)+)
MTQKKILILWLGAFGFAIAKHLWDNNPDHIFYASEINLETFLHIKNTRQQPYFFPGVELPDTIELIANIDLDSFLPEIDIIISVIPCQFLASSFEIIQHSLKDWVIILNLSKGINNQTLAVASETLQRVLEKKSYQYVYLAGGMIAEELIQKKVLWADIVTKNSEAGALIKKLFDGQNLHTKLKIWNPKNTELAAALKNIVALVLGYYEGQGAGASTLGYYFSTLLCEVQNIMKILGEGNIDFTDYALSWDLIATCFGNSRNRLLGNMLGKWMGIEDALAELKAQKKIAEGYETLKGIKKIITWKEGFEEIGKFCEKYV